MTTNNGTLPHLWTKKEIGRRVAAGWGHYGKNFDELVKSLTPETLTTCLLAHLVEVLGNIEDRVVKSNRILRDKWIEEMLAERPHDSWTDWMLPYVPSPHSDPALPNVERPGWLMPGLPDVCVKAINCLERLEREHLGRRARLADITEAAMLEVRGCGPKMAAELIAWRDAATKLLTPAPAPETPAEPTPVAHAGATTEAT